MSRPPLLELRGVTKRFPGVLANDDVSLVLAQGEVLGILGENGAGKSTLMNILAGLVLPDAGEIFLDGAPVRFGNPRDAAAAGIGRVHQHFKLIGALTVRENLALGDPRWGRCLVAYRHLTATIGGLAADLSMSFDPGSRIDDLSIGRQQQVEILKALARDPSILILNEPTSVLAPDERAGLFAMMGRLKHRDTGIILISHRLDDILEICDRVIVMRQGRVLGGGAVVGLRRADLVRMVVGDDLPAIEHRAATSKQPVLTVEGLTARRPNGTPAVLNATFTLKAGEITGLCGVEGNGQSELIELVAGMRRPDAGRITYHLHGKERQGPISSERLRALGVAHIAEDRLAHAVVPAFSLAGNWLLTISGMRYSHPRHLERLQRRPHPCNPPHPDRDWRRCAFRARDLQPRRRWSVDLRRGTRGRACAGDRLVGLCVVAAVPAHRVRGRRCCGGLVGWLRARFGANEIIVTIIMNYVALQLLTWVIRGPLQEPMHIFPRSFPIGDALQLPIIAAGTRLHAGVFLAALVAVLMQLVMWRTAFGFSLAVLGENPGVAAYAGINARRATVLAMAVSGAFAGLAGAVEIAGVHQRLQDNFAAAFGLEAIAAALMARLHPIAIPFTALLFGVFYTGTGALQRQMSVPFPLVWIIEGMVILAFSAVRARRVPGGA